MVRDHWKLENWAHFPFTSLNLIVEPQLDRDVGFRSKTLLPSKKV